MKKLKLHTATRSGPILLVGLTAVALVLAACSSTSSAKPAASATKAAPDTVVVGIALSPPKMVFLAPYVADLKGFFAKQNINVKFLAMPNGLETELGTTSGAIDFGFSSATDGISSAAAGSPIHVIWSYAPRLDTQCIADGSIKTAKDLVGQNVASTGTGGFSYTQVYACLKDAGVAVKDVKLINMPRSQFVPALVSKRIKAAVFHADDAYVVLHSGVPLKILANEYETMPQWWYGGVAVLDSYASSHADLVKRFLTAMVQADRWMTDPANRDEVIKIGVATTKEDPAAVAYAYDFIAKGHGWTLNSGMDPASVTYTAQQMLNFKEIDKLPAYSSIVDDSYIKSVLATLGTVPE
jgi:NitT/TauT family transport system substrate-binding protein